MITKKFRCQVLALFILLLIHSLAFTKEIDTFYGSISVEEPVLLELIESPAFQRLKYIHQYGVSYYTTHREEYDRYTHSLGVFALLRAKGLPLEEQIAGLLHDVSHTAFSHVGDWVFGKEGEDKDYQNSIHIDYLERCGIGEILEKYGYTSSQMEPTEVFYPALESPSPSLCADRIEYNIQGAYYQGFITYEEAMELFEDLRFIDGVWIGTKVEPLKKLVRSSLFMTLTCWGSPTNHVLSRWLADAILRAIEIEKLSYDDFCYGIDQVIWDKLLVESDPIIASNMHMIEHYYAYFSLEDSDKEGVKVKNKFRGIDPWIIHEGERVKLLSIDPRLDQEFQNVRAMIDRGWTIRTISDYGFERIER